MKEEFGVEWTVVVAAGEKRKTLHCNRWRYECVKLGGQTSN